MKRDPLPPDPCVFSEELVERIKKRFQPHSKEPISDRDARDMLVNMAGFARVLTDWERKARERAALGTDEGVHKGEEDGDR